MVTDIQTNNQGRRADARSAGGVGQRSRIYGSLQGTLRRTNVTDLVSR